LRSWTRAWDSRRSKTAIEFLRKNLQVAPDYVDATFNLALLLQRKNQCPEAADYWRRYHYRRPIGMSYPRTPITEIL
jgi:Tfp pilus assembly protein PilF